jgi:hypothetical protein
MKQAKQNLKSEVIIKKISKFSFSSEAVKMGKSYPAFLDLSHETS